MLKLNYQQKCSQPSDIFEHLPILYEYTQKCDSVVECGVRDVVSSYSFAYGLKGNQKNSYIMIDIDQTKSVEDFLNLCKEENVNASFIKGSDLNTPLVNTDLLFIDTWHCYAQLKRELEYWNSSVNKYIIMHDTSSFEMHSDTYLYGDLNKDCLNSGFSKEEVSKGLWPAIVDFLKNHSEWTLEKRYFNNNGLTILARLN